jgi:hypothetical protein
MKAFNLDRHGVPKCGIVADNISLMRKKMYGKGVLGPIAAAPSRFALKVFGGYMSIEEFRSYGDSCRSVVVAMPDEVTRYIIASKPQYVMDQPEKKVSVENKISSIQHASGTNETLKLKRPKPLKRDDNNLEKTLGIIRSKNNILS